MREIRGIGAVVVALMSIFGGADRAHASGICSAGALSAALAAASPGDVVEVGACRVSGSFTVPAGVTLRGSGARRSTIAGGDPITLETGSGTTALTRLRVESHSGVGVRVSGSGAAAVRDAAIDVSRGVGIAAGGTASLTIANVDLTGAITASTEHTVAPFVTPDRTSTHGIWALRVGSLSLSDVTIGGFARAGALVQLGHSSFSDVRATGNVAVGIAIAGGSAALSDVRVQSTWDGMLPADSPPAGVAIVAGAAVTTSGLSVSGNDGFGVFHDRSGVVEHADLSASGNGHAAVWAQRAGYLQLDDARILSNDYAGVVAVDTVLVSMVDGRIEATRRTSPSGFEAAGDGIQLVRTEGNFTRVLLRNNARIGLLAELASGASTSDYGFADVTVDGSGSALGLILQRGGAPLALVESGITRLGATAANDAVFVVGGLDLGIVSGKEPDWLAGILPLQGIGDNVH